MVAEGTHKHSVSGSFIVIKVRFINVEEIGQLDSL